MNENKARQDTLTKTISEEVAASQLDEDKSVSTDTQLVSKPFMPTTELTAQRETKLEALLKELLATYFTDAKVQENPALANTRERLLALSNLSQTTQTTRVIQESRKILSDMQLGDNAKLKVGAIEANDIGVQIIFKIDMATPDKTPSTKQTTELEQTISNLALRNLHFTGRDKQLKQLKEKLLTHAKCTVTQTIAGLGGVGKSSLVREYAYQQTDDYQIIWWCDAATLDTDYYKLAEKLNKYKNTLGLKDKIDVKGRKADSIREDVKDALSQLSNWLLIIDNAADEKSIQTYLPNRHQPKQANHPGHVLITSRSEHWQQTNVFSLSVFNLDESVALLDSILKGPNNEDSHPDQPSKPLRFNPEEKTLAKDLAVLLGNLPLALMQAGFYMKETGTRLEEYIERFKTERKTLWPEEEAPRDYHATVAVTWKISMEQVKNRCQAATTLLNHCAYLASTFIDKRWLEPLVGNQLGQAIRTLRAFSLIDWLEGEDGFKCHNLVQTVIRDAQSPALRIEAIQQIMDRLNQVVIDGPANAHDFETNRQLESHLLSLWQHYQDLKTTLSLAMEPTQVRELALNMAELLSRLGLIYQDTIGTSARALGYLTEALAIRETQLGPSHPGVAASYNNLGMAYHGLGSWENVEQAIAYHEKALSIWETQLGPTHPDVALSYNNLAEAHRALGGHQNIKQAIAYHEKALSIWETQLGPTHPQVALSYNNLAVAYHALGCHENVEPAITYFKKALSIWEIQLGPSHPQVAMSYNNLAAAYLDLGGQENVKQAIRYHEKALTIRETQLGPTHPQVAASYNNLAAAYQGLDDHKNVEQAIRYHEKALSIRETQFGPSHPQVALSYNNLAVAYHALGGQENIKQAIAYHEKALSIWKNQLGPSHPQVATSYNNLGEAYRDLGGHENVKQAITYYEKALEILETQLGSTHPYVATSYNNLGLAYQTLGGHQNIKQAIAYHEKALAIRKAQLGPSHPQVAGSYNNLAEAYRTLGSRENIEQAITYFKKALRLFETQLSPEHPHLITCGANLKNAQAELTKLQPTQANHHANSKTDKLHKTIQEALQMNATFFQPIQASDKPDDKEEATTQKVNEETESNPSVNSLD